MMNFIHPVGLSPRNTRNIDDDSSNTRRSRIREDGRVCCEDEKDVLDGNIHDQQHINRNNGEVKKKSGRRRLQGNVSRIVVNVGGLLVEEMSARELSDGATAIESSVGLIQDIVEWKKDVYLVCEVEDDVGEAVVLGALEHAGLVSSTHDATSSCRGVPQHRVIFCSSPESKVSIVRQLDPGLYLDIDEAVCRELSRFMGRAVVKVGSPVQGNRVTLSDQLHEMSLLL